MARANPQVVRHRPTGTKLQVVCDSATGLEEFASIERRVIAGFERKGGWPHKLVHLFVFETLQPLVEQIKQATSAQRNRTRPGALAKARAEASRHIEELDRKPMVHIYNLAKPDETSIFVNRRRMIALGLWDDALALEGLLAHEHAHPLAENSTTIAARGLTATVEALELPDGLEAQRKHLCHSVESVVEELCLHAPHEVAANELAIRAGFGEALFHLNCLSLTGDKAGLTAHAALKAKLDGEVKAGHMTKTGMALMLTMASIEAHVRVALESAAFLRACDTARAAALDSLIDEEVFKHVEPEAGDLYRRYCARYAALAPDMDADAVLAWMQESAELLTGVLRKRHASFKVDFDFHENQSDERTARTKRNAAQPGRG
jgi:hypothetical protein